MPRKPGNAWGAAVVAAMQDKWPDLTWLTRSNVDQLKAYFWRGEAHECVCVLRNQARLVVGGEGVLDGWDGVRLGGGGELCMGGDMLLHAHSASN